MQKWRSFYYRRATLRVLLLLCKQTELSTNQNVLNNLISIGRSFNLTYDRTVQCAEIQKHLVTSTKKNTGNTVIFNNGFDKSFD